MPPEQRSFTDHVLMTSPEVRRHDRSSGWWGLVRTREGVTCPSSSWQRPGYMKQTIVSQKKATIKRSTIYQLTYDFEDDDLLTSVSKSSPPPPQFFPVKSAILDAKNVN